MPSEKKQQLCLSCQFGIHSIHWSILRKFSPFLFRVIFLPFKSLLLSFSAAAFFRERYPQQRAIPDVPCGQNCTCGGQHHLLLHRERGQRLRQDQVQRHRHERGATEQTELRGHGDEPGTVGHLGNQRGVSRGHPGAEQWNGGVCWM